MQLSRRDFTRLAGGLAAAGPLLKAASKIPVGLELYSIREDCAKDWPGSLKAVAEMGYEGVEFAGYHDWSANDLKKLLDDNGLQAPSAHVSLELFAPGQIAKTIEFHRELGINLLVVPSHRSQTVDGWREFAGELTRISEQLKPHGMRTGYHNHYLDFAPIDGQVPWDIVFENTPPEVTHEADVGHMLHGGVDPATYIRKYANRTLEIHAKDYDPNNEKILLGEGKIDWKSVIAACEAVPLQWYIVEQEVYPYPPLECVKRSLANFRKLLAAA